MLLTKEVEVMWMNKTKAYYINKGYVYTKNGDIFTVKTTDLPRGSSRRIKYVCDNCNEIQETDYGSYCNRHDDLCRACASKIKAAAKMKMSFDLVVKAFKDRGYTLLSKPEDYINAHSKLKYYCKDKSHGVREITYGDLHNGYGCMLCARELNSGEGHYSWTGLSALSSYLRSQLSSWTQQQLQRTNYTCEITRKHGTLNVHHMYSFNNILQDTLDELNIDARPSVGDYSEDELQLIVVNFLKNNDLKAQPIVMLEEIHQSFHRYCGGNKQDTSFEQLNEFIKKYERGEIDV
jgi:hypothetical protein